jgi:hypothetical protein
MRKNIKSTPPLAKKHQSFRRRILTDDEIDAFSEHMRKAMGSSIVELSEAYGVSIEDGLRFQAVAARIEEARTNKGLTLKKVAETMKVPQYRLGYIEKSSLRNIDGATLLRYINFLGLATWFGRWKKANTALVERIGLE